MKVAIRIIVLFIFSLIVVACNSLNNTSSLKEKLLGKWKLDSVSTPNGGYIKTNIIDIYHFKDVSNFTKEWADDDIGNTWIGKYALDVNPRRSFATITFNSNFQMSGKDTIRREDKNLDIIGLNNDRLHVIEPTIFIDVKGKPSIVFNKHCIYKRVK
jgi:hypothetical protein